jgi:cytochrome c oxidase assembly protein subunit 15
MRISQLMKNNKGHIAFKKTGIITILAVYLLILVGGIVRSTGSGMGCPDWPKCFGKWVPPTEESQLSNDYREKYAEMRRQKNLKLAGYLDALGYSQLSYNIAHDPSIYNEPVFNPVKTWIEYFNRLVGVVIGFLIFATFLFSLKYWKTDKIITIVSALAVLLVGFQGWIGSVVVSTNLLPVLISIHMAFAIIIVAMLIYVVARSYKTQLEEGNIRNERKIKYLLYFILLITFAQILLGTQIREQIDAISYALGFTGRHSWIERLDNAFYVHRSFSTLIFLSNIYLVYLIHKHVAGNKWVVKGGYLLLAILFIEICTGVVMTYFSVPAFAQPLHLLLATVAIGTQFFMLQVLGFLGNKERHTKSISKQFA